jgi:hypothetical protein
MMEESQESLFHHQNQQQYSVLYWIKRNNKVHKSKGVSKMDGILTIENAPSNLVSLDAADAANTLFFDDENDPSDNDDDEEEDDDEDDENKNAAGFKRNWKPSKKKRKWTKNPPSRHRFQKEAIPVNASTNKNHGSSTLYSAVLPNLVQQAFQSNHHQKSLSNHVILDLSKWQVQILSRLDSNVTNANSSTAPSSSSSSTTSSSTCGIGTSSSTSMVIGTTSLVHSLTSNGLLSNKIMKYPLHAPLAKRSVPLTQRHTMTTTIQSSNAAVRAIPFQDRKPPAQPQKKKDTSFPNDTTNDVLHDFLPDTNMSTATRKPVPLPSLNRNRLVSSRPPPSSSISISLAPNQGIQRKPHTLPSQNRFKPSTTSCVDIHPNDTITTKDDFFPGAIGTIPVPMSIKQILKPHQITGVAFLWNALTGACPKLQRELTHANDNTTNDDNNDTVITLNEKRGAILADEMGLGKTLMTITTIVSLHRRNRSERFIVICPSSLVSNWAQEFDKFLGKASQPHRVVIRKGGEEGLQKLKSFVQMKHTSEGALKCVCHNVILFVMNP